MAVVGLTGEPACGKSLVAFYFKQKGAYLFDADQCVHDLYADKNSIVYKAITRNFACCMNKGMIDRALLGKEAFSDPKKLEKLEKIVHPAVIRELKAFAARGKKDKNNIYAAEVPLLFEKGLEGIFDVVVVVLAKKSIILRRLQDKRKLAKEEALRRLAVFMPIEEKSSRAEYVIENNSTKRELKKKVDDLWEKLKEVR